MRHTFNLIPNHAARVMPPTFAIPEKILRETRFDESGNPVPCVVIDTIQSQANRMEPELAPYVPYVEIDFSGVESLYPIPNASSLTVSHRIFDAQIRDSELDGVPFFKSPMGREILTASRSNALPMLKYSPSTLLFGAWNSFGGQGINAAKFQRCITSEIIAFDVQTHARAGVRFDNLGLSKDVMITGDPMNYEVLDTAREKGAKAAKGESLSSVGHGSIPFQSEHGGISAKSYKMFGTVGEAAIRQLRFGSPELNAAAHAYLSALGALAFFSQFDSERMLSLRSGCEFELEDTSEFDIFRDGAFARYEGAVRDLANLGVILTPGPVATLKPSAKFAAIIAKSQQG